MAVRIRYKANGMKRSVADFVARKLVSNGVATYADAPQPSETPSSVAKAPEPQATIDPEPEPVAEAEEVADEQGAHEDSVEISPRTGKPKRPYTRRDMQAED
jgi:hypothetical protein